MTELGADLYDFQYHSQIRNKSQLGGTRTWNRLTLHGGVFKNTELVLPEEEFWLPSLVLEPGLLSIKALHQALEDESLTKLHGLSQAGHIVVESVVAEKMSWPKDLMV